MQEEIASFPVFDLLSIGSGHSGQRYPQYPKDQFWFVWALDRHRCLRRASMTSFRVGQQELPQACEVDQPAAPRPSGLS
jgi:hypothetical protein